ncbi:MAG: CoA-binding protein [Thermodesulfobacteriota bacterium]|nr:CoA-binding protein [Thermodesulfobacteriota bacterium]
MLEELSHNLDQLFYPKSIAVVGASPRRGRVWSSGNSYLAGSMEQDFQGRLFPVHPKAETILGFKSYRSIRDIPYEIDLVIFTVPSSVVLQVMEDCVKQGVKFVHLLTAGFSETGREEYAGIEKELIDIAKKGSIGIIGPNCMGVYCPEGGLSWSSTFSTIPGSISFFSQSGQLAGNFVQKGSNEKLRFSKVVSFGNASGLQAHDFLNYFAKDEKTKIIGSYIEGLKDGRAFFEAARDITRTKPLVVWKGGQTEGGSRATQSHTAAIAGSPEIWRGFCKQVGIIPVHSIDELVFTVSGLERLPMPRGTKVAILGGGGGGSVTMTDIAEKEGLKVPHLSGESIASLEKFVPLEGSSAKNPLDIIPALRDNKNFLQLITLLRDDPNIDALIFTIPLGIFYNELGRSGFSELIKLTIEAQNMLEKPLLTVFERDQEPHIDALQKEAKEWYYDAQIATFPSFELAARVLVRMKEYRDFLVSKSCNESE